MTFINEEHSELHTSEAQDTQNQEPDLDKTTFFAEKEYLDGRELSFSQKVEKINALLLANTLNRPVLYRILAATEAGSVSFDILEMMIQDMPEFKTSTQPQAALIDWLVKVDALALIDVDIDGNRITEETRKGKTEDEIDDLVFNTLVELTEYGKGSLEIFNPRDRIELLLGERPQRYDTYIDLLNFMKEKRTYNEIDSFLRGNPILLDGLKLGARPMQPSVLVDKLSSAGAIYYEDGWMITPEGESVLGNSA